MNQWEIQRNAMVEGTEEKRGPQPYPYPIGLPGRRTGPVLLCPKPRRIILSRSELLDMIGSSGPFCGGSGSPPIRVSNPIIKDAQFGDDESRLSPLSTLQLLSQSQTPSPTSMKSGGVRVTPKVRVEGFEWDSQNSSITAMA